MSMHDFVASSVDTLYAVVPDVEADAPEAIKNTVGRALSLAKYGSIVVATGIFIAMGVIFAAGERDHGPGLSSAMKKNGVAAIVILACVAGATEIVEFFSA